MHKDLYSLYVPVHIYTYCLYLSTGYLNFDTVLSYNFFKTFLSLDDLFVHVIVYF